MKKIFLLTIVLVMALMLVACSPKTALTEAEFSGRMEQAGYSVEGENYFDDQFEVTSAARAVAPEDKFTIDFAVFPSDEQARTAHGKFKEGFKALIVGASSNVETNVSNFNTYRARNNGMYYVSSRIDSTLLCIVTEDGNTDAVNEALKTLGYW